MCARVDDTVYIRAGFLNFLTNYSEGSLGMLLFVRSIGVPILCHPLWPHISTSFYVLTDNGWIKQDYILPVIIFSINAINILKSSPSFKYSGEYCMEKMEVVARMEYTTFQKPALTL